MNSTPFEQLEELFFAALDRPEPERRRFIESICGDDTALIAEVLEMAAADARSSPFDHGVAPLAEAALTDTTSAALASGVAGRYRIKHRLGRGGMGAVYLAERVDVGGLVAIKVLDDAGLSPARRSRFLIEQRMLARLNHPLVAALYDAGILPDGTPYFVMEYVEGQSLSDYCRDHPCSIAERLGLFSQICQAVQYAHGQAVLHRDLKPSNILVAADGSVRLLDFGIAKHIDPAHASSDATRSVMQFMTPAYAAPEQVRHEPVGVRTDVYSLGVILYELLAGSRPYDLAGCSPAEAEIVVASWQPVRPSAVAARKPGSASATAWPDLDVLCLKAMHKDAAQRYGSVEAMLRDVHHYLRGEPLEARADTLRYRARKFVGRNRRSVTAAALVAATLIALVAGFTIRLARARDAALAEAARTQRVQRFMLNLLQGGEPLAGPASDLRVIDVLARGEQSASALTGQPDLQAELYDRLGTTYESLGAFDKADPLLQKALELRTTQFGPDHATVADSLVNLSLLRVDQTRLDDAEPLARRAVAIADRAVAPSDPTATRALLCLGRVLIERGSFQPAIDLIETALSRMSDQQSTDYSVGLGLLGVCHYRLGNYEQSDAFHLRAMQIDRHLNGDNHPDVASDLMSLATSKSQRGRNAEAEALYRQALEIYKSWYGDNHPETADAMVSLARPIMNQGRAGDAAALIRRALAIEEPLGPNHERVGMAVDMLGGAELALGNLEAADADYRRALQIYVDHHGENHYLPGIAMSHLGDVEMKRQRYAEAAGNYEDAIRRFVAGLPAGHLHIAIARVKLGRALLRNGRLREAEVASRAGYEGLKANRIASDTSWMTKAREDLLEEYEDLGQAADATRIRVEIAQTGPPSAARP